ncbi:glycoside hydrolase family 61 protein [Irpex rosettiformis]|uniref:Glycoside hydrolase family 61 protein n=1 Tax=Irpex rosettiformis TaxID=378272 RepID=A0ACB8UF31_9APHY|nr:glycoside hydrolase family 61 protein [Irpex rosettiformis]
MKTSTSRLLSLVALSGTVSAHTIFQELWVNGVDQGELTGIRAPDYDGPIQDVTSNDIICNGGINPYHQPVSQAVISAPAGATLTTQVDPVKAFNMLSFGLIQNSQWHHTLNQAPNDPADPIDASHKGPVISYLAKIPNATQTDVTGLKWFKIYEDGFDPSTNTWAVDTLIANKGKVTFTIPKCIEDGQYLLRHEIIALHAASSYPGAQFYMECAQLQITGGTGAKTPATVSFPGAYSGTNPGITINIYYPPVTNYTIPGPAVFTC